MLSFETLAKYVFRELTTQERKDVWETVKQETVHLEDLETIETLKEQHNFKSSKEFLEWASERNASARAEFDKLAEQELTFAQLMDEVTDILNPRKDDMDDLLDFLPEKSKVPMSFGSNEEVDESKVEKLGHSLKGQNIEQVKRLYEASDDDAKRAIRGAIIKICVLPQADLTDEQLEQLLRQYLSQGSNEPTIWTDFFALNQVL